MSLREEGPTIRPAAEGEAGVLAEVIRVCFRESAERFGVTEANAPRHAFHTREEGIRDEILKGVLYLVLESRGRPVGCVSVEKTRQDKCVLRRLAVLPPCRGRGWGALLLREAVDMARSWGAEKVGIAVIHEEEGLRRWYGSLGFRPTATKAYDGLPFRVTFMELSLGRCDGAHLSLRRP